MYFRDFLERCINNYCQAHYLATRPDAPDDVDVTAEVNAAVCESLSEYSSTCAEAGVVLTWRTSEMCRKCYVHFSHV